jgi:hypothetical protein
MMLALARAFVGRRAVSRGKNKIIKKEEKKP